MKIALYGYGKMGQAIEQVALARGHSIALRIDHENAGTPPLGADVAIEFSTPATVLSNLQICLNHQVPVVVGTTGWYGQMAEVKQQVNALQGSLLWASNFSIGVNLFFTLNKMLSALMERHPGYAPSIREIHHRHKLDAPSGTAITLAEGIVPHSKRYTGWGMEPGTASTELIPIQSERTGEVPGTHTVAWQSAEDRITITHEAFGRQGFATGAVVAAEWLLGRTGCYTMEDVLAAPPQ